MAGDKLGEKCAAGGMSIAHAMIIKNSILFSYLNVDDEFYILPVYLILGLADANLCLIAFKAVHGFE